MRNLIFGSVVRSGEMSHISMSRLFLLAFHGINLPPVLSLAFRIPLETVPTGSGLFPPRQCSCMLYGQQKAQGSISWCALSGNERKCLLCPAEGGAGTGRIAGGREQAIKYSLGSAFLLLIISRDLRSVWPLLMWLLFVCCQVSQSLMQINH